jgi:hypothetical protein
VLLSFLALSPLLVILRAQVSFPSAYMCPLVSLPVSHLSAHLRPASYPRAPVYAFEGEELYNGVLRMEKTCTLDNLDILLVLAGYILASTTFLLV